MFERAVDTEHVFGQDIGHDPNTCSARRRDRSRAGSAAVVIVLCARRRGVGAPRGPRARRCSHRGGASRWSWCSPVTPCGRSPSGGRRCRSAGVVDVIDRAERDRPRRCRARTVDRHPTCRSTTQDGAGTVGAATTCCGARPCDAPGATPTTIASSIPGPRRPARRSAAGASAWPAGGASRTFERVEDVGLVVVKRDGSKDPFDRAKLESGIMKAHQEPSRLAGAGRAAGRPRRGAAPPQGSRGHVAGGRRGGARRLAKLDQVAYMRFASVYKDFQEITDFEQELGVLLEKKIPAKRRAR